MVRVVVGMWVAVVAAMFSTVVVLILASSESFEFEEVTRADRSDTPRTVQRVALQPARGPTLLERDGGQVMVRSTVAALVTSGVGFGGTAASLLIGTEVIRSTFGDGSATSLLWTILVGVPLASLVAGLVMTATLAVMAVAMISLSGAEETTRRTAVTAAVVSIAIIGLSLMVVPLLLSGPIGFFALPGLVGALGLVAGAVVPVVAASLTPAAPEPTIPAARF